LAHIIIKDTPCGYGKSSRILAGFDKREKYIAVLPYLSEVDRFVTEAQKKSGFTLTAPQDIHDSKSTHCEKLVRDGKSIACTHPNPQVFTFLGWDRNSGKALAYSDAYALTELVQWLFRSAIRKGGLNSTGQPYRPRERVTLYMPAQRMRNLLLNWLITGRVHSGPVVPKGLRQMELLASLEGRVGAMAA
jgi:hypothetical protein